MEVLQKLMQSLPSSDDLERAINTSFYMVTKDKPNKVTATLKVVITGEFYDDEASEETLRYCVEQDLEDAGFDVDVSVMRNITT